MREDASAKMTPLDCMVSKDQLQLLKAAIPYANPKARSMLSIFAKTLELKETIRRFSGVQEISMMSSTETAHPDTLEILQDLGQYLSGEMKENLDNAINTIITMQMFQMYQEDGKKTEGEKEENEHGRLDQ